MIKLEPGLKRNLVLLASLLFLTGPLSVQGRGTKRLYAHLKEFTAPSVVRPGAKVEVRVGYGFSKEEDYQVNLKVYYYGTKEGKSATLASKEILVPASREERIQNMELAIPEDADVGLGSLGVGFHTPEAGTIITGGHPPHRKVYCTAIEKARGDEALICGLKARVDISYRGASRTDCFQAVLFDLTDSKEVSHGMGSALGSNLFEAHGDEKKGYEGVRRVWVDIPRELVPSHKYEWRAYIGREEGKEAEEYYPQAKGGQVSQIQRTDELMQIEDLKALDTDIPGFSIPGIVEESPYRIRACLNGVWEMTTGAKEVTPLAQLIEGAAIWEPLKVPGYWHYQEFNVRRRDTNFMWYRMRFPISKSYNGKQVKLLFEGIRGGGYRIYANGRCLQVNKTGSHAPTYVDITEAARFLPEWNEVYVLIADSKYYHLLGDGEGVEKIASGGEKVNSWGYMGIFKDVWLEVMPKTGIKDIFIMPSVRKQNLSLRIELENGEKNKVKIGVKNRILRHDDQEVKASDFEELEIVPGHVEVLEASIDWKNPRYWSHEDPYLYWLETVVKEGSRVVDVKRTRFGFRELWVEGGDFYLNGKKTHLRTATSLPNWTYDENSLSLHEREYVKLAFKVAQEAGFNCVRLHVHSTPLFYDMHFDIFDELGIMIVAGPAGLSRGLADQIAEGKVDLSLDPHADTCRKMVRFLRNHPSIVVWEGSNELLSYGGPSSPTETDLQRIGALERWEKEVMSPEDPTRLIIEHNGGYLEYNPVMNFHYFFSCSTPLAEREECISLWARDKKKAFTSGELGLPAYGEGRALEAMYLGQEAYKSIGMREKQHCLHAKDLIRAWRYYGISSLGLFGVLEGRSLTGLNLQMKIPQVERLNVPGPHPDRRARGYRYNPGWDPKSPPYNPNQLFSVLQENFSPVLVYLGGESKHPTWKDHSFFSDSKFEKSIIAINDLLRPVSLVVNWAVKDEEGRTYKKGKKKIFIPCGEVTVVPLEITAPLVKEGKQFHILLEAYEGDRLWSKDTFDFQVFPEFETIKLPHLIALWDEKGYTQKAMQIAGVNFDVLSSMDELDISRYKVLVIGRESMGIDLFNERMVNFLKGGGKVVIFEQVDSAVYPPALGVGVESISRRKAFMTSPSHPLFKGLEEEDFCNWQGESDIINPAYGLTEANVEYYTILRRSALHRFRCGNKGIVTSYGLSKPFGKNSRVLLETGEDLRLASLVEYRWAEGLVVLCQLDVSSRYGKDPVATQVVNNILEYLSTTSVEWKRAVYMGDEKSEDILKVLGVEYKRVENADDIRQADVLILGKGISTSVPSGFSVSELLNMVKGGKEVFFLPQEDAKDINAYLPFNLSLKKEDNFNQALVDCKCQLFEGISNADLCYSCYKGKGSYPVLVFDGYPEEGKATEPALILSIPCGKGRVLFCQLSHDLLGLKKGVRVFSTLLTNLGVGFKRNVRMENMMEEEWSWWAKESGKGAICHQKGLHRAGYKFSEPMPDGTVPMKVEYEFSPRLAYDQVCFNLSYFGNAEDIHVMNVPAYKREVEIRIPANVPPSKEMQLLIIQQPFGPYGQGDRIGETVYKFRKP